MLELLTAEDVAELFKVDKTTIRSWVHRKKFPDKVLFKIPGGKSTCIRFIKPKLEDWINGSLQT